MEPEQTRPAEPELAVFRARPGVTASCSQSEGDGSTQRLERASTQLTLLYQDGSWAGSVHPPKRVCGSPSEPALCYSLSQSPVAEIAGH